MRAINKTMILATTMLVLVLTAVIISPAMAATNMPTAKTAGTIKNYNGHSPTKNTGVSLCNVDKAFLDPRNKPANGGYTGCDVSKVQVFGWIAKTMGQVNFPVPLTTTYVSITTNVIPAGDFALVDDFLPAGFSFANPTVAGFIIDGVPATNAQVVSLFDGFVRFRLGPGAHAIQFSVVSPKWGVSYFSSDFARIFIFNAFNQLIIFDYTFLTVFVQGTGSFIMATAMVSKPNYKPQWTKATCAA